MTERAAPFLLSSEAVGASRRAGFTLTEIAIVLGIMGLVLGGIWVAAENARMSQKIQYASGQYLQVIANYKAMYAHRGMPYYGDQFHDVTCSGANNALFPSGSMSSNATCITGNTATYPSTPWGNGSYIKVEVVQNLGTLVVSFWNLPHSACPKLASTLYNSPDMVYQYISNNGGIDAAGRIYNWLPPINSGTPWTVNDIIAGCAGGTMDGQEVVEIGVPAQ